MTIDTNLQVISELNVQYDTDYAERRCVIALEHTVDLHSVHGLMCCEHPVKSIQIEEGYKLRMNFKSCRMCAKCNHDTVIDSIPSTIINFKPKMSD